MKSEWCKKTQYQLNELELRPRARRTLVDGLFSKENQLELRTLNGFSVCLWNKSRIFAGKTPQGNHPAGVFAYGMDLLHRKHPFRRIYCSLVAFLLPLPLLATALPCRWGTQELQRLHQSPPPEPRPSLPAVQSSGEQFTPRRRGCVPRL